jgi:3-phenylpropionate/trans-cinnamate dioxygenase ferredoxin reductase subunit
MEMSGVAAPGEYDKVVYRGDVAGREFVAFWLHEGRVVGGMNVNVWDVNQHVQELIRSRRPVDPGALADAGTPLESLLALSER